MTCSQYATNPSLILGLMDKISQANISLQEITSAITLLQKVHDILSSSQIPLPPLELDVGLVVGKCAKLENNQQEEAVTLLNSLKELKVLAIMLLNSSKRDHVVRSMSRKVQTNATATPTAQSSGVNVNVNVDVDMNLNGDEPPSKRLEDICYICKEVSPPPKHAFYPWLCGKCGDLNYQKRFQTGDLSGRVALVTGGRTKIGFEIVLKLLKCDTRVVIVTTRFPVDALRRYEREKDFESWKHKLLIYRLDLRFLGDVEKFCDHINKNFDGLDILIQNAAQTIRRPTVYYRELLDGENNVGFEVENGNIIQTFVTSVVGAGQSTICDGNSTSTSLSVTSEAEHVLRTTNQMRPIHCDDFKYEKCPQSTLSHFPSGQLNKDGDPLDLRQENSWTLDLEDVHCPEMVEVSLVNYMAPYVLLQRLTPLMKRGRMQGSNWGWVILVSAMEGKFEDCFKTSKHPHTNAAKAALNMLVRTCAKHYHQMGLLMSAVDTGWVTQEHPQFYRDRLYSEDTPLDCIDGAARVLDPIFETVNSGSIHYGKFMKDYFPTSW